MQDYFFPFHVRVSGKGSREQGLGVGVQWVVVKLFGWRILYNAPQVHDRGLVGHVTDGGEIVRHQKESHPGFLLQIHQQVHYLGPDGNIQGGYRFVEHHQLGIGRQGAGNRYALPLSAAELVRIQVGLVWAQANLCHYFRDPVVGFLARDLAVCPEGLGYDFADFHSWAQGRPGVLENRLYLGAKLLNLRATQGLNILVAEKDFSVGRAFQP